MSLVEAVLACLEARLYLVVKGAKEYFFLSALIGLVKAKLSPAQANTHKQEVVDRILSFAQSLFSQHALCNHLGDHGMGSFAAQVRELSIHSDRFLTSLRYPISRQHPSWASRLRPDSMET